MPYSGTAGRPSETRSHTWNTVFLRLRSSGVGEESAGSCWFDHIVQDFGCQKRAISETMRVCQVYSYQIRCQKRRGHAHRRGQLSFRARPGRTDRYFSSQCKAVSERIAVQKPKGELVELTVAVVVP